MVLARSIVERLVAHKSLLNNLQFAQIVRFFDLTDRIWPEIVPPETSFCPPVLPLPVSHLLASVLSLDLSLIQLMWTAFGYLAQQSHAEDSSPSLDDAFRIHGHSTKIGAEVLSPPISFCLKPACNSHKLAEVLGRLYTLRRGVLPIFSKSLYCRYCHTRYYHNYFVTQAGAPGARREYYSEKVPAFLHVSESAYIESDLCRQFGIQMALAHDTCQGIARVYNKLLGDSDLPTASRLSIELTGDLVLDGFLLHAIFQDKQNRREILSLPHEGYQNHRYDEALAERNRRMAGTGQDMSAHSCNRCMKIYQGEDGRWYRMTAGVHDGVTVRHLCCAVHDCLEALPSQRAHFCYTHRDLAKICAIQGCNANAEPGFHTCKDEEHRAFQKEADERNTAMFQLRSRLRKADISEIPLAGSAAGPSEPLFRPMMDDPLLTAPPPTKIKGRLTRSWTHNEQLFVRCCGIIISRATLFGAEGVTSAKAFLKCTFPPEYPGAMPSYIFYDNNCSFLKHLQSCGDHYFDNVGLPVDWVFNSSAAEQANVWFGKYQNIVQDMAVLKYNFYLDEMIRLHNEDTAASLAADGHVPHLQSESLLRGGFPFI
ncbi:hypothetical protein DFH06DRAFT_1484842 [Mycena polygramma]|nr:hypothetical protein DFH06DRAFT_1484842 [Mycena polygramma]